MRELSVVGPAPTPSSVCTHCLSGSCDQHSGHKEVGTLLNSPGQGQLGVNLGLQVIQGEGLQVITIDACKERQVTVTHNTRQLQCLESTVTSRGDRRGYKYMSSARE